MVFCAKVHPSEASSGHPTSKELVPALLVDDKVHSSEASSGHPTSKELVPALLVDDNLSENGVCPSLKSYGDAQDGDRLLQDHSQ